MTRSALTAALVLAALGFGSASEAKAQYTVYIWNMNRNDGWVRSGVAGTIYTTKQACLNNINARVAENKRFRTNWEAFAVVKTGRRPNPGYLNAQNVQSWWQGQIRFIPVNTWYNITVQATPARPGDGGDRLTPGGGATPLFRRETDYAVA